MSDSFASPWSVACKASLSVRFSRQEFWSGLSFPSPEILPDPESEFVSPALTGRYFTAEPRGKPKVNSTLIVKPDKKMIDQVP